MGRFPYGVYYRRLRTSKVLQLPANRVSWFERFQPPGAQL
jgi:hypothetical protein